MKVLSAVALSFFVLGSAEAATFKKIESMSDSTLNSLITDFDGTVDSLQESGIIDTAKWGKVISTYSYAKSRSEKFDSMVKQLAYKIEYQSTDSVKSVELKKVENEHRELMYAGEKPFGALSYIDNPESDLYAFGEALSGAAKGRKDLLTFTLSIKRKSSETEALVLVDTKALEILVLGTTADQGSTSSASAGSAEYQCECYDTGFECDGYETMKLNLKGSTARIAFSEDPETDHESMITRLDATFDPSYSPREHKTFGRYTTTDKTYPYVLIELGMKSGTAKGFLKLPEMTSNGSYGHTWEYECSLVKR